MDSVAATNNRQIVGLVFPQNFTGIQFVLLKNFVVTAGIFNKLILYEFFA
jgi:hypothetical protein